MLNDKFSDDFLNNKRQKTEESDNSNDHLD